MKTFTKTMYATLVCVALVFTGCNKSDDDGGGAAAGGGGESFTAQIDGASFAASTDFATLIGATKTTTNGSTTITAQGSTNDGDFINFAIMGYTGTGTYRTGDSLMNSNFIQYGKVSPLGTWASNLATAALGTLQAGQINITIDADGVIEGTFSFEGYNGSDMTTKNVTQGSFKAALDN